MRRIDARPRGQLLNAFTYFVWLPRFEDLVVPVPLPQSARLTAPVEINAAKKFIRRSATICDRTRTPTSMFRSWAASVKFADETKDVRSSMTTHLAWRTDFRLASKASDRGSK